MGDNNLNNNNLNNFLQYIFRSYCEIVEFDGYDSFS